MKKFFYLLSSLIVFSFVACQSPRTAASAATPRKDSVFDEELVIDERNTSSESVKQSSDEKPSEPVWSTADADVSHIDVSRKLISFTFDDAPDSTLKALMRAFAEFNQDNPDCPASATFFANGIRVDSSNFPLLQAAYDAGFELGNHTDAHKNLTKLPSEKIRKEIDTVDEILKKIDGKDKHLVRVPYGRVDEKVKKETDAPLIDWAIDTEDWKGISADKIYRTIYSEKYPGAIVLMHDGYPHTVEAVKRLLPDLKKAGYQVVNVSQLSKALECPLFAGTVYTHIKQ